MKKEEITKVQNLISVYDEYINLLANDINDAVNLLYIKKGILFESARFEDGVKLRMQIIKAKEDLNNVGE